MGKKDSVTKLFYSKPQNFVSVMNLAYNFGITNGEIEEMNENLLVYVERLWKVGARESDTDFKDEMFMGKERDVLRKVRLGEQSILIGIENQTYLDASEPIRVMIYDALTYEKQRKMLRITHENLRDLKGDEYISGFARTDRVLPVMTIIIYYGEEKWNFPGKLSHILDVRDSTKEVKIISSSIQDYELKIIDVRRLPDEVIETLAPEVKLLFGCVKYSKNYARMKAFIEKDHENFEKLSYETFVMIAEMTNTRNFLRIINDVEEGGRYDMCKAFEDWIADEVSKAVEKERENMSREIEKEIEKERENMNKEIDKASIHTYIETCREFGVLSLDELIRRVMAKFSFLTEEQAISYVTK